jgi:hypothetical protein
MTAVVTAAAVAVAVPAAVDRTKKVTPEHWVMGGRMMACRILNLRRILVVDPLRAATNRLTGSEADPEPQGDNNCIILTLCTDIFLNIHVAALLLLNLRSRNHSHSYGCSQSRRNQVTSLVHRTQQISIHQGLGGWMPTAFAHYLVAPSTPQRQSVEGAVFVVSTAHIIARFVQDQVRTILW